VPGGEPPDPAGPYGPTYHFIPGDHPIWDDVPTTGAPQHKEKRVLSKLWLLSTGERLAKSFVQGYIAFWTLSAGFGNTPTEVTGAGAFDLLFTWDNVKAGVVMAVFSMGTSFLSTGLGPDKNSPSLVVTETKPTV
jgi:hypothetical protein